jgi:hypothetical protein
MARTPSRKKHFPPYRVVLTTLSPAVMKLVKADARTTGTSWSAIFRKIVEQHYQVGPQP